MTVDFSRAQAHSESVDERGPELVLGPQSGPGRAYRAEQGWGLTPPGLRPRATFPGAPFKEVPALIPGPAGTAPPRLSPSLGLRPRWPRPPHPQWGQAGSQAQPVFCRLGPRGLITPRPCPFSQGPQGEGLSGFFLSAPTLASPCWGQPSAVDKTLSEPSSCMVEFALNPLSSGQLQTQI